MRAVGLGEVLAQYNPKNHSESHTVSYANRILSDTKKRYSQVEKEALAVVWACERFNLYVKATKIVIITDNKATELIFKNP